MFLPVSSMHILSTIDQMIKIEEGFCQSGEDFSENIILYLWGDYWVGLYLPQVEKSCV